MLEERGRGGERLNMIYSLYFARIFIYINLIQEDRGFDFREKDEIIEVKNHVNN